MSISKWRPWWDCFCLVHIVFFFATKQSRERLVHLCERYLHIIHNKVTLNVVIYQAEASDSRLDELVLSVEHAFNEGTYNNLHTSYNKTTLLIFKFTRLYLLWRDIVCGYYEHSQFRNSRRLIELLKWLSHAAICHAKIIFLEHWICNYKCAYLSYIVLILALYFICQTISR